MIHESRGADEFIERKDKDYWRKESHGQQTQASDCANAASHSGQAVSGEAGSRDTDQTGHRGDHETVETVSEERALQQERFIIRQGWGVRDECRRYERQLGRGLQ
jgi:hypothetical protein